MEAHLGHEAEQVSGNHRNGHNRKRVLTEDGALDLEVPRDRQGRFEPQLVEKYARRLPGFDDKVISMYARGMTTREIRAHNCGAVRVDGVGGAHLQGHRCGVGRGRGVAVAPLGGGVRDSCTSTRCG